MIDQKIDVVIPAYNEEQSIGLVVRDIPKQLVREVVVVDNRSTDKTGDVAAGAGAMVIREESPGYGNACLRGLFYLAQKEEQPDIVVFLDGDYSDYPEQMNELVEPIVNDGVEMVIGSRKLGKSEKGSMTLPQVFGNWLSTKLMRLIYGAKFTDLGPFRAIQFEALKDLQMQDRNYGWTIEMQIKAVKAGLSYAEIPVDYRNRIGQSKVSGTFKGAVGAGYKILRTIWKYR